MKQIITGYWNQNTGDSTFYWNPLVSVNVDANAAENNNAIRLPAACTFRNLRVRLSVANSGSQTQTVTLRKNGADQALTVTVGNSASEAQDTSNSVSYSAGDQIALTRTATGSPSAVILQFSLECECDADNTSLYSFGRPQGVFGSGTQYIGLGGVPVHSSQVAEDTSLWAVGGTLTGVSIILDNAPGAGDSRTVAVMKNGVTQDGSGGTVDTTVSVSDAVTTADASFSLPLAAGDVVGVVATSTGTPTAARIRGVYAFVSAAPNRWCLLSTTAMTSGAITTRYVQPRGQYDGALSTVEADVEHIGGVTPFYVRDMRASIVDAPGTGDAWAFVLRRNQAATSQAVTITDANTTRVTAAGAVRLTSADRFCFEATPVNSPASLNGLKFGLVATDDPSVAAGFNALLIAP